MRAALAFLLCLACARAGAADLAYLGPRGTYSEQAAIVYSHRAERYGELAPMESIGAVVEAVAKGQVARGVIPAATPAGLPPETLRALLGALDPGVRIVGLVTIPAEADLMARPGTRLEEVRTVLSSPAQLGEARAWLEANLPEAARRETATTAAAAEAAAKGDGTLAAIAAPPAADLYRLDVLAHAIQENKEGRNAYWVLAPPAPPDAPRPFPDATASRAVVTLDAPAESPAFSALVAGFHGLGWRVVLVAAAPLPGRLFGYRYLIHLAARRAEPVGRLDDLVQHSTAGGAKALLLGAWRG